MWEFNLDGLVSDSEIPFGDFNEPSCELITPCGDLKELVVDSIAPCGDSIALIVDSITPSWNSVLPSCDSNELSCVYNSPDYILSEPAFKI